MIISKNQWLPALLFCLPLGCSQYQAKPLTEQAVQQQLQTPSREQLTIQAAKIKYPLLEPLKFTMEDGLSPDEAAVLAVLRNPELRAIRDQHGIANAQLLQAGLLPDPQISYTFSAPAGGTDLGMNNALGFGLSWQATALIWRQNKIAAAQKQQQAIDLQIAWQEWQFAQAAKLATYQLIVYHKQQGLLTDMAQRLEENRVRLQEAAVLGLVTELERVAAVSAKNALDIRLLALEQQTKQQQQRLNRALGLKPYEAVTLQQNSALLTQITAATYDALIRDMDNRRLDLMALKRGYESQEASLHVAVLQQFPQISIGFDHARDNSNLYTMGFGVSMTLPVFDRNQGQIALERATRQQLFDQYTSRLFQARADIAELLVTIASINQQIQSVRHAIPDLAKLVNAYQSAIENGQVDVLNYYVAWNSLTDKKIDLLTLELQLVQAGIALEVASGRYHTATDFYGK
ncbi:MAG: TolC family protein [Methylococcaceae bacterium]|nr:TolC family protein [Methylococcaceae bacterium]MDZ4156227.1 TolC family protein [Methylococcales bacterium]MDP2393805.1 TolC family protein [Methylococcaceae bacterium]MDP3019831.1 TolC family protein [Methylococcaceae bacterium]MDP3389564.1 TolC family protein [Methylococcaceae bacterium]